MRGLCLREEYYGISFRYVNFEKFISYLNGDVE